MKKTKRPVLALAKKSCVTATQVALAMMAAPIAFAQQAEVQKGERIEITGTRIPSPNLESASPVTVISAQDIKFEGVTRVEDMLNSLPQVFADFGANVSNGATGTATVNLRGLGAVRTLVLMNGKRLPIGTPGTPGTQSSYAPDINQIPAPLIQRIEVLTGGASAVYGSDAVAGVVNFIMRDNFEGVQGDVNYSWYSHNQQHNGMSDALASRNATNPTQFPNPGDFGSKGESTEASLILGGNFAGGKGNATVFFDYKKDKPLTQDQYNFSACASAVAGNSFTCGGSSANATGRFLGDNPAFPAGVTIGANGPRAFSTALDQFNYAPYNYYQRPDERYGFNASAHYDINPHVRLYGDFNYHDSHTVGQIAPSGIFAFLPVTLTDDNPLLTPAVRAALGMTGSSVDALVARRNVEGGPRQDDIRHTSGRTVLGIKGDVFKNWDYDLYMQTARVTYQDTYRNEFLTSRTLRALDAVTDPATGLPACRSALNGVDPACVPYNMWVAGGVTPAALGYIQGEGLSRGETTQSIQGGTMSTDLGNYGWRFPGAKQGVGLAVGFERRVEKLNLEADLNFNSGDLAGQGGPKNDVNGKVEVKDFFGELRIPIRDFLSINGSYRYSDYSTGLSTDSYGLGIELTPVKTVKLRGSYQQAVRAPNILELFQPQGLQLFNMDTDPCGTDATLQPVPTASATQCARSGLSAANYGSTLLISPAGQYNALAGGNPTLDAETAKTYTLGVVWTPLRNFSATIDYFNIKVEDVISTLTPSLVLNQCVFSGQFCSLIHRAPNGNLWFSVGGGFIEATNINVATFKTSGLDIALNYNYNIGRYGGLGFSFIGTWLESQKTEPIPGLGEYECAGFYGTICGNPQPQWRHKFRTVWSSPWNFDLAVTWRHIDKVDIDKSSPDALLVGDYDPVIKTLGTRDYLDLALTYSFRKNVSLRFGVNNVFDRDPPLADSNGAAGAPFGNGNTFPQIYDSLGRKFFTGVTVNF